MKLNEFIKKHLGTYKLDKLSNDSKYIRHYLYSKDRNVVSWVSSPLQGVYPISYTDRDRDVVFGTFGINYIEFKRDILSIDGINPDFNVSTTPEYVLCTILMHLTVKNGLKDEKEILENLFFIMAFRIITSAYSNYYQYPVDEKIAREVYNRMSKKFLLKKLGSNYMVIKHKSKLVMEGDKYKELKRGRVDDLVLVMNAISTSVRQYIHTGFLILLEVLETGPTEAKSSAMNIEDGEFLGIENNTRRYYEAIEKILANKQLLMNRDVLYLINDVLHVKIDKVPNVLEKLHEDFKKDPKKTIKFIDDIVSGTLYYLFRNDFYPPYEHNITLLITYLRAYWGNSKVKNEHIVNAKKTLFEIIIKECGIRRPQTVMQIVNVVTIYLFVLAVIHTKNNR